MPEELGKRPEELYTEHETRSKDLKELTSIENGEEADIAALREINSKLTAIKAHIESRDVDGIKKLLQLDRIQEVEAVVGKLIDEFTEFIAQNDPNYIVKKEMAQGAIDANLWRAQQHFRANEAGYKQQAVNEAQAAGKDVKYGPYTNADPVYDYDKHRKLVFDANSDPKPVTVEEFAIQNKQIQAERDAALADPTLSDDEKFAKFVDAHRKSTELERRSPFRSDPDTQVSRYNRKFAMEVSTETDIDKLNQDLQSAERDISRLNDQLRRAEDLDDQENIRRCEAELQKLLGDASIIRWRIVRLREQDEDALSAPPPPPSANLPTEEPEWDRPVFED